MIHPRKVGVLYGRADGAAAVVDAIAEPRQERRRGGFSPLSDAEGLSRADRVAGMLGLRRIGVAFAAARDRHRQPEMDGNVLHNYHEQQMKTDQNGNL